MHSLYNRCMHDFPLLQCVKDITADAHINGSPVERVPISAVPKPIIPKDVCTILSKKRESGAETDSSLLPFITSKKRAYLLEGVTSFERLLFMFTASADGVSIWKHSKINNSLYVFSLFNENVPRRSAMRDLDAFFVFLVRCNKGVTAGTYSYWSFDSLDDKPSDDQDDSSSTETTGTTQNNTQRRDEEKRGNCYVTDSGVKGVQRDTRLGDLNTNLCVEFPVTTGKTDLADSDFREILHLVLGYIKEFGKRGFCIRSGSTLYSIQYAISSFRCDIPAQDMLVDSSGKHTSNSPCLVCDTRRRVFDKYYMGYLPCVQASMSKNRDKLKTLNSSALVLERTDPLRLLPAFLLGKNMDVVKETMKNQLNDNDATYQFLQKLRSLIPASARVYQLPDTQQCNYYGSNNPFTSTNPAQTTGRIDIDKTTYLTKETCTSADLMHLTHNVADRILQYLFVPNFSDTAMEEEVMLYSQSTICQGVVSSANLFSIDQRIRGNAIKRLELIEMALPLDLQSWVVPLIKEGKYSKPTANQKMRFCFSFLPYILIDSLHDCAVWCFVQFFSILSTMYNFDGPFEEMESLQGVMTVTLYVMENQLPPSFFTICFHQCLHFYKYYGINGPLKSVDCYHGEEQYLGLADESVGGNNPELTVAKRKVAQTLSRICSKGVSLIYLDTVIVYYSVDILSINDAHLLRRGDLNWLADKYRFTADSFPHVSFTDVEFCGGVHSYLDTGCLTSDSGFSSASTVNDWTTSDEDLDNYWEKHYPNVKPHFQYAKKWNGVTWNNKVLRSFNASSFLSSQGSPHNGLAVAYSVDRRIHLFAVADYYTFHVTDDEVHFQARAYELPIHRLLSLNDCPFSFYLKVSEINAVTPRYTMLSLHRLHMTDVFCFPIDNETVYVGINTTCIRQWQILHRICFPYVAKESNEPSYYEL